MTRTSNTFGGFAFAVLAMFALWTSTLAVPQAASTASTSPVGHSHLAVA